MLKKLKTVFGLLGLGGLVTLIAMPHKFSGFVAGLMDDGIVTLVWLFMVTPALMFILVLPWLLGEPKYETESLIQKP